MGLGEVGDGGLATLNNIIGWGICLQTLGTLTFSSFQSAATLLVGLFAYDVIFTFFTPVMVTVATKIEAPIKFEYPILTDAMNNLAYHFSILGLGDVVIPGLFVGFLYSFERFLASEANPAPNSSPALNPKPGPYLTTGLGAYATGLGLTFAANRITGAGQPALFYIVPCLMLATLGLAQSRGELKTLLSFDGKEQYDKDQAAQG
mmetsp:Transcript_8266/g.23580  ORF Transcript_8266/g.23580 Transcript_8266/m.23580 type:complete len:205 (-) Transcript_8266:1151-1765(-)